MSVAIRFHRRIPASLLFIQSAHDYIDLVMEHLCRSDFRTLAFITFALVYRTTFHCLLSFRLAFLDSLSFVRLFHKPVSLSGPYSWTLTKGLDSYLAADGSLSAGEAQLLAFSRIFLADPQLIILDEASSRLDPATEQQIENALDKVLTNRTVIIVAHRLTTVYRADEIMILSQGRVVEHGTQEVLLADSNSNFNGLLQTGLEEAIS